MASYYAILVVWPDGATEFVKRGLDAGVALFSTKKRAEEKMEFLKVGLQDDVQSISVVKYANRASHV